MLKSRLFAFFSCGLLASLPVFSSAARAADVGLVASVSGPVEIFRPAKDKWSKASPLQTLAANSKVRTGTQGSAVVVLFEGGKRFQIAGDSVVSVSATECQKVSGTAPKALAPLATRHLGLLKGSRIAGGKSASYVVRGGKQMELQSLTETATLNVRPTFRWKAVPGAASYKVRLEDQDGTQIWQAETETTNIAFPAKFPELKPGGDYVWTVTTVVGNDTFKATGLFWLLPADKLKGVNEELEALKEVEDEATRQVLRAEIYARAELWDEAIASYEKLAEISPELASAHSQLAELLAAQGRKEEADRHRKLAEGLSE